MNARTEWKETITVALQTRDRVFLETVEEEKRGTRIGTEGKEGTQKGKMNGEIERNASKLETVDGGGNRVKQRERDSRGGGGGRVVLRGGPSERDER